MHLSKPLIIIGGAAVAAIVVTRKVHRALRLKDLVEARLQPVVSHPVPCLNLASFQPGEMAVFCDEDGYSWEITMQRNSKCMPDGRVDDLLVWSDSPLYLRSFGDKAHGDYSQLAMPEVLEQGSAFALVGEVGIYDFPPIAHGTLRRTTQENRHLV